MFLSFDVDAESAWTSKDATHAQRLITMSYGGYEARVGTPKLLELLDQLELKATFFITGWSVDAHPAMAESITAITTCCPIPAIPSSRTRSSAVSRF
jgi:peptidoglycan/xylan/chitin deacetylase (PgdA/CDA1 family)